MRVAQHITKEEIENLIKAGWSIKAIAHYLKIDAIHIVNILRVG